MYDKLNQTLFRYSRNFSSMLRAFHIYISWFSFGRTWHPSAYFLLNIFTHTHKCTQTLTGPITPRQHSSSLSSSSSTGRCITRCSTKDAAAVIVWLIDDVYDRVFVHMCGTKVRHVMSIHWHTRATQHSLGSHVCERNNRTLDTPWNITIALFPPRPLWPFAQFSTQFESRAATLNLAHWVQLLSLRVYVIIPHNHQNSDNEIPGALMAYN